MYLTPILSYFCISILVNNLSIFEVQRYTFFLTLDSFCNSLTEISYRKRNETVTF